MLENYIATYLIDISALIFLCYLIYNNSILDQNRKGPFYLGAVLTVLIILSEAGTILVENGNADLRYLSIIFNVFGFALTPVIPIFLIVIFDANILKTNKLLLLPSILNMFSTVLSPWLGFVFYVDTNNHYERGNLFFIFVASYIINVVILLTNTVMTGKMSYHPIKAETITLSIFAIAGTSIQLILPSVHSSWHSMTLSLLLYYILLSEYDGSFDVLTRLYNRAAFEIVANKIDGRKPFSVVVMDINDFKEINDSYGHDFGDCVLKRVASVIRESFDDYCTCYRVGGDEIYVIIRAADPVKLEHQLKSITNNLEKERKNDSRLPTISYGYSIFKGGYKIDFQEVLKEADNQMYYFKKIQKDIQKKNSDSMSAPDIQ